ncbi:MAG: hypothetical protein MZV64_42725 [Ignavibacteriales bacterium]|nr:hypothetical protein [Ignavibacteriales bacterium]
MRLAEQRGRSLGRSRRHSKESDDPRWPAETPGPLSAWRGPSPPGMDADGHLVLDAAVRMGCLAYTTRQNAEASVRHERLRLLPEVAVPRPDAETAPAHPDLDAAPSGLPGGSGLPCRCVAEEYCVRSSSATSVSARSIACSSRGWNERPPVIAAISAKSGGARWPTAIG